MKSSLISFLKFTLNRVNENINLIMNFHTLLFSLLFSLLLFGCNSQSNNGHSESDSIPTQKNYLQENLPAVFKDFPVGIDVKNEPDTIYAEHNERGGKKYIWKHTTTIKAIASNLQIIEFGTYNFKKGEWKLGNKTKKPYTAVDFDKWYCRKKNGIITFDYCQNGNISKGVEYIDPSNYCISNDSLVTRHGLWYYIGIDSIGKKHMGFSRYYTVNKLKN
jgi:hypothetical protein